MTSTAAGASRTRMDPDSRREQLLELGVELFATRSLDELGIDVLAEAAGISRGLLYHYFGSKQEFHEAVVRRSVEHLIEVTAPVEAPDLFTRLWLSLERYVDYVVDHHAAYLSIVRAAHAGDGCRSFDCDAERTHLVRRRRDDRRACVRDGTDRPNGNRRRSLHH